MGFFQVGDSEGRPAVQCFHCFVVISDWGATDIIAKKHLDHSPCCMFVRNHKLTRNVGDTEMLNQLLPPIYDVCGNDMGQPKKPPKAHDIYDLDRSQFQYSEYASFQSRLDSFKTWKFGNGEEMALAGFFLLGEEDKCACFSCGLILRNWDQNDVPQGEHDEWCREYCIYREFTRSSNGGSQCSICLTRNADVAFVPCGHVVACSRCAIEMAKCPFCPGHKAIKLLFN